LVLIIFTQAKKHRKMYRVIRGNEEGEEREEGKEKRNNPLINIPKKRRKNGPGPSSSILSSPPLLFRKCRGQRGDIVRYNLMTAMRGKMGKWSKKGKVPKKGKGPKAGSLSFLKSL